MEYGSPTTLQGLYEQKVQAYQEELEALTSKYHANISELQLKIASCRANVEFCQKNLDYSRMKLSDLSPTCPQDFIRRYLDQWYIYGSTAAAEQAARNAWAQEYNRQVDELTQIIASDTAAMKDYQSEISQYEDQIEILTAQYTEDVKALQAKYAMWL
jgi:peptidoglycan hydrolase CwlO-like protein